MEHIRALGKKELENTRRINALESWVTEHEKVKSKHETIMWSLGVVALLGALGSVVSLLLLTGL